MYFTRSLLLTLLGFFGSQIDPSNSEPPKSSPEQRQAFARQSAESYRFRINDRDRPAVKLHQKPLLRWTNEVVQEDDGMLFLWTEGDGGRPIVAARLLQMPNWSHEFQSLTIDGFNSRSESKEGADWAWQPKGSGLEFVRATDADPPAAQANQRLRQMKAIADRFSAVVDQAGNFESPEQLRLLTTPIYRYSAEAHGILDGAMFAFTQGTNPEVLILVEAQGTGAAEKTWRYGFARMSSFHLRVLRDDKIVWTRDRPPVPTRDPTGPYFFRWHAQTDRSAELNVPASRGKQD